MGPRNCIGKNLAWSEMHRILVRMVWNFDISVAIGPDGKKKELEWATQKTWVFEEKKPFEVNLFSVRDYRIRGLSES